MSTLLQTAKHVGRTFTTFSKNGSGIEMRPYQAEAALAIVDSIIGNYHSSSSFPAKAGKMNYSQTCWRSLPTCTGYGT
jgi:hypothetical protein